MKKILILSVAIEAITFTACNSSNNKSNENSPTKSDTALSDNSKQATSSSSSDTKTNAPLKEVVSGYLQIKNALVNDNGKDAATAGKSMADALSKVDKKSFTADQKKIFDDAADDVKEHGEHISMNGGDIAHQREHFDMLSQDMYDLVKAFGAGEALYQDYCPMYNNKKGATWLSEAKEIKNPYLGKKTPTCGSVKEEIKQ